MFLFFSGRISQGVGVKFSKGYKLFSDQMNLTPTPAHRDTISAKQDKLRNIHSTTV